MAETPRIYGDFRNYERIAWRADSSAGDEIDILWWRGDHMEQNSDTTLRFVRLLFYVALGGWFYVIGCWLGPNELTFHKLEGMTTADFVPIAQKYCAPVVREIKIYR